MYWEMLRICGHIFFFFSEVRGIFKSTLSSVLQEKMINLFRKYHIFMASHIFYII